MNKPAVFLDRDGVLNFDKSYVYKISDFEWIDGSREAIKFLKDENYLVFVVTNQSGITRGFYSEKDVEKLHKFMNRDLLKMKTEIDDFFYSPYHPDVPNKKYDHLMNLRKPNTGMLEIAEKKWMFDKKKTFMIGDKKTDIECATNYGIKGFQFKGGNLLEFVKNIIC